MTNCVNEVLDIYSSFGFTSHQYPNVAGMWKEEMESLVWLCEQAPQGSFMEIGSHCGSSAVLMCLAREYLDLGPTVYSVDLNFDAFNGMFKRNVYKVGKFNDIHKMIQCNSKRLRLHYDEKPLSLCLVDGWHSYKGVLNDFEQIEQYLVDGSYVVFHDVPPRDEKGGWDIDYYFNRQKEHRFEWLNSEIPDLDTTDLTKYHGAEGNQDFFIMEAITYIMKSYNYRMIDIPIPAYTPHFDRTGGPYVHGRTSPYHGLCAIQKIGG